MDAGTITVNSYAGGVVRDGDRLVNHCSGNSAPESTPAE